MGAPATPPSDAEANKELGRDETYAGARRGVSGPVLEYQSGASKREAKDRRWVSGMLVAGAFVVALQQGPYGRWGIFAPLLLVVGVFWYFYFRPVSAGRRQVPLVWSALTSLGAIALVFTMFPVIIFLASDGISALRFHDYREKFLGLLFLPLLAFGVFVTGRVGGWLSMRPRPAVVRPAEPLGDGTDDVTTRVVRTHRWRVMVSAGLVGAVIAGAYLYAFVQDRYGPWFDYRRAAAHSASPALVVMTEDLAEAKALRDSEVHSHYFDGLPVLYFPPGTGRIVWYRAGGAAFLGTLRTPPGRPQVCAIVVAVWPKMGTDRVLQFQPFVIPPVTFRKPGRTEAVKACAPVTFALGAQDVARALAGQVDPADPAHVMIPFFINGRAYTLHGRLRGDGKMSVSVVPPLPTTRAWDPDVY